MDPELIDTPIGPPTAGPRTAAAHRSRGRVIAAVILAAGGLGFSGWLTWLTLDPVAAATGCGGPGSTGDCHLVWASRWSHVLGVPVSVLAAGLYLAVLLLLPWRERRGTAAARAACGGALIGAAAWFTWLQLGVLGQLCRLCLATHLLGLALGLLLLLWPPPRRSPRATSTRGVARWVGGVAGLAAVGLMAAIQLSGHVDRSSIPGPAGPVVEAAAVQHGDRLTLLDGRLTLDLATELWVDRPPHAANAAGGGGGGGAERWGPAYIKLFDYGCSHCRTLHRQMQQLQAKTSGHGGSGEPHEEGGEGGSGHGGIMVPVPLGKACNPVMAANAGRDWYAESCGLAKLAWAVHRVDPAAFEAFHEWMFADGWPRTLAEARGHAMTLVDLGELNRALVDPAGEAQLQRNIAAWSQARAADVVGGLPVLLTPAGRVWRDPVEEFDAAREVLGTQTYIQ